MANVHVKKYVSSLKQLTILLLMNYLNCRSRPTGDPISFAQPKEIGERKGCPPAALILCLSASSGATCATQPGSQLITLATADFEQFAPLNPADVRCKAAAEGKVNQWWVVIPAKAGKRAKRVSSKRSATAIQHVEYWIPAFAGMTGCWIFESPYAAPNSAAQARGCRPSPV